MRNKNKKNKDKKCNSYTNLVNIKDGTNSSIVIIISAIQFAKLIKVAVFKLSLRLKLELHMFSEHQACTNSDYHDQGAISGRNEVSSTAHTPKHTVYELSIKIQNFSFWVLCGVCWRDL